MQPFNPPIDLAAHRVKRQVLSCIIDAEYGFARYDDGSLALVIDVRLPASIDQATAHALLASMRLVVRDSTGTIIVEAVPLRGYGEILHWPSGDDIKFILAFGHLPSDALHQSGATAKVETIHERGGCLCVPSLPPPDHA